MTHIPYGYKNVDAKAELDQTAAARIRTFFAEFLICGSMRAAAKTAGIEKTHSVVGRILKNETYLGTDFYPQLIDEKTFKQAQELREKNAHQQGRIREYKPKNSKPINLNFSVGSVKKMYQDPYEQARYAYEQIKETCNE